MKINLLLCAAMMLMLGVFFSCSSEDDRDGDIDWSKIDLSNIDDLYAQPLPVIKKCIEGKWKVYVQYGGYIGISYPKDTYVEYFDDHSILTNPNEQYIFYFTWKRQSININDKEYETWVMHNNESGEGGAYFFSIKNDTLSGGSVSPSGSTLWQSSGQEVKVK
jgi:hypothetical protein